MSSLVTRADLVVAVYRHHVEACAGSGPVLLAASSTPHAALASCINLFVDFLVTNHGLAGAMQSDRTGFEILHANFLDRLVPVCAQLLKAAADPGEIRTDTDALELLFGVGNLCIGAENNTRYDARRMVELVVAGLRLHQEKESITPAGGGHAGTRMGSECKGHEAGIGPRPS